MVRKFLIAGSVSVAAVFLAGCGTVNQNGTFTPPVVISVPKSDAVVDKIVNGARSLCGVIPSVETVGEIIATFTGGGAILNIAETVVNGICNSLKAKSVRRGARAPVYRGVVIRYTRV